MKKRIRHLVIVLQKHLQEFEEGHAAKSTDGYLKRKLGHVLYRVSVFYCIPVGQDIFFLMPMHHLINNG